VNSRVGELVNRGVGAKADGNSLIHSSPTHQSGR
jgi:hypothetical protein